MKIMLPNKHKQLGRCMQAGESKLPKFCGSAAGSAMLCGNAAVQISFIAHAHMVCRSTRPSSKQIGYNSHPKQITSPIRSSPL